MYEIYLYLVGLHPSMFLPKNLIKLIKAEPQ